MSKVRWGSDASRSLLNGLMDPATPVVETWSPDDLRAVLEHQLRTPIALEAERLSAHRGDVPEATSIAIAALGQATYLDVLQHAAPDAHVLAAIKEYAKEAMVEEDGLPRPVARFLYIASILRARSAGNEAISSLDPATVESEARRYLTLHWLPENARAVLRSGLAG